MLPRLYTKKNYFGTTWANGEMRQVCTQLSLVTLSHTLGLRRSFATPSVGLVRRTAPRLASKRRYRGASTARVAEDAINPLTKPTPLDKGALHVVSTPIGNLKDLSLRALEVLNKVDYIVCTNRQATKVLLDLVDVDGAGRLIHYRPRSLGGNEKLAEMLKGGRSMALVVPTGTPCIGDDGDALVREMLAQGIRVTSVPGPSAVTSAVSVSGLGNPDGTFYFGGTLSEKPSVRQRELRRCTQMPCPSVFFEFPRRIVEVLTSIAKEMPERRVALLHELTRIHESLHCDIARKLLQYYTRVESAQLLAKGQVTLVIEGMPVDEQLVAAGPEKDAGIYHAVERQRAAADGGSLWEASKLVAMSLSVPQSEVEECYRRHAAVVAAAASHDRLPENTPAHENKVQQPDSREKQSDSVRAAARLRRRIRLRKLRIRRIELAQERIRLLGARGFKAS